MSQSIFKDPIVSAGPNRTGTGTGTLTVDRLTHFTINQTYTCICIATTPDTIFSISGDKDGPVGIATVGVQFFDQDLKVFLTIQQGSTLFQIGDTFTFTVVQGTDLNQTNIDTYDELSQKNFGAGIKGQEKGDNNIRYSDSNSSAYLFLQDLKYTAAVSGSAGNNVTIEYANPVPAVAATLTIQDLTFTAVTAGAAGNSITMAYEDYTPATRAFLTLGNLKFSSQGHGASQNSISMTLANTGVAGSETVSVVGTDITVSMQSGVSTASQIKTALDASIPASALIFTTIVPTIASGPNPQTLQPQTFLSGGADAIGDAGHEVVTVVGTAIQVQLQSGVSTATQVKAALDSSVAASALISTAVSGIGSNTQTAPAIPVPTNLSGGANAYGYSGSELAQATGNAVKVFMESRKSTAQAIANAVNAAVSTIVTAAVIGVALYPQTGPISPTSLIGGTNKFYSLNKHELTDSGNFFEGNAGLNAAEATITSELHSSGHSEFSGRVLLDNSNSPAIVDAQQTINDLIQNGKLVLKTADDSKVAWSVPSLTFTANILVEFPDTGLVNTILLANSPITVADGQSAYILLNRSSSVNVPVVVASLVPKYANAFRLFTRYGNNIVFWNGMLLRTGHSARIGEGGDSSQLKVNYFDPVTTTLPTSSSYIVDGFTISDQDTVLFANLLTGNNQIYQASVSGPSVTWAPLFAFPNGLTPGLGDSLLIVSGKSFALQYALFDGTSFRVNDGIRYFGEGTATYFEQSGQRSFVATDGSSGNMINVAWFGSENMIIDYSVIRGTSKEVGSLYVTTEGTVVEISSGGVNKGDCGVTFSGSIVSSNIVISYTLTSAGTNATIQYSVKRWSDAPGGPGGIPSYASGGPAPVPAAGSNGDIQFNGAGFLSADNDFTWDSTNNILTMAGLQITGLQGPLTVQDNMPSPLTLLSVNSTQFQFCIIEFSLIRNNIVQLGRMLVTTDGSAAEITVDSVQSGFTGVEFSALLSGTTILVQYTSTNTGFNGNFKYSMRRWI